MWDRCLCEWGRWQVGAVQTAGIRVLAHQRWDVQVTILKWSGSPGWQWAVTKILLYVPIVLYSYVPSFQSRPVLSWPDYCRQLQPCRPTNTFSLSSLKGKSSSFSLRIPALLTLRPWTLPPPSPLTTLLQCSIRRCLWGQALSVMEVSEVMLLSFIFASSSVFSHSLTATFPHQSIFFVFLSSIKGSVRNLDLNFH